MTIDKIGSLPNHPSDTQSLRAQATDGRAAMLSNKEETSGMPETAFGKDQREMVEDTVKKFNDFLEPVRRNLKFELHDRLEKYYVTVIDSTTDEVIKEIPPKQFLDMYAEMAEFMGLLVDRKI
jgi:flagellar protein FlaG